jgi:hypothetical protein
MEKHHLDGGEKHALGRRFVALQPAAQGRLVDIQVRGEPLDAADDQAGAVQRARTRSPARAARSDSRARRWWYFASA